MVNTLPAREQVRSLLTKEASGRTELLAAGVQLRTVAALYPLDFEHFLNMLANRLTGSSAFSTNFGEQLSKVEATPTGNWELFIGELSSSLRGAYTREYNQAAATLLPMHELYQLARKHIKSTHASDADYLTFFYVRGVFAAYWLLAHEAELQALSHKADVVFEQIIAGLVPPGVEKDA